MATVNEELIRNLLIAIGENPDREGLIDTPKRVVKSWNDIFAGYKQTPEEVLKTFFTVAYDEMIICKDIEDKEQYTISEEHDEILEKLEGKEFEFTHQELFPTLYMDPKEVFLNGEPSANPASDSPEVEPIPESQIPSEKSEEI